VYSSSTLKEHKEQVKKVLQKLKEKKLYLQLSKCKFYIIKTNYLSFVVLRDSIAIDLAKVQTVQD
jgi:hypothetical protein